MNRNDQEFIVQKIRTQYTEKEHTQIDALRELDAKVRRPAKAFACVFGAVSAVVMGAGMSLVMTDVGSAIGLESAMAPGVALGIAGLLLALLTYPIYKRLLASRKRKFAGRIMELSDEIIGTGANTANS